MNRRQRRANGQRRSQQAQQIAACPDCDSIVTVTEIAFRVYTGTVEHDDTCPWFTAFIRDGGHGIRLGRLT